MIAGPAAAVDEDDGQTIDASFAEEGMLSWYPRAPASFRQLTLIEGHGFGQKDPLGSSPRN